MKVTLQQIVNAYIALRNIEKEKTCSTWAYRMTKNKAKMQSDIDGFIAIEKNIAETQQKRREWLEKHCEKDETGKPIMEKNSFGVEVFKGIDQKEPELIAIIDELNKHAEAYNELLKSEVEIDFILVDVKELPQNISQNDVENLMIFIKEETK